MLQAVHIPSYTVIDEWAHTLPHKNKGVARYYTDYS